MEATHTRLEGRTQPVRHTLRGQSPHRTITPLTQLSGHAPVTTSLWHHSLISESTHSRPNTRTYPWGVCPTPLIPAALRAALGAEQAPDALCTLAGKPLTFSDLGADFWDHVKTVDKRSLQSLVDLVASNIRRVRRVPLNLVVGNQDLAIGNLPLTTRTQNALRHHFGEWQLPAQRTVHELLTIRNFGIRCLLEFVCVLEAVQSCEPSENTVVPPDQRPDCTLPSNVSDFFQLLGAWAAGEQQLNDLSSALPGARTDWPEELQHLWVRVERTDAHMLAGDTINKYSVQALVSGWINGLDERLIQILEVRVFVLNKPETLKRLGELHGVTRERVRQIEKQSIKRLELFKSNDEYRPVLRRSSKLRERIGVALPENDVGLVDALNWVVADFDPHTPRNLAQQLFLWLAGPYKNRNGWLIADPKIVNKSKEALLEHESNGALIRADDVRTALNELGIPERHHGAWIDHLKIFKRVDEGLLHFAGSIPDKAEMFLRYIDRPISADEIFEFIGSSSVQNIRQRLIGDPRFWRINKQNQFVLAGSDGYDEYTGITDEIIQELKACGGSATIEHLVQKITSTYGVQPNSVIASLKTPLFVGYESGLVRPRENEKMVIETDISKTPGCYLINGKWAWRTEVDQKLLKGSGRIFPNALARELGCDLGEKIEVDSVFGNITISWLASSISGASLGSIRCALKGLGATDGDYVFIIAHDRKIEFQLLRQEQLEGGSNAAKLGSLVGIVDWKNSDDLLSKIATALACDQRDSTPLEQQQQIRDVLLSHGEGELGDLIKPPKLSMDQYLYQIAFVLGNGN